MPESHCRLWGPMLLCWASECNGCLWAVSSWLAEGAKSRMAHVGCYGGRRMTWSYHRTRGEMQGLLGLLTYCRAGYMLEPFNSFDPPEGSDVEAVRPGRQGVVQWPIIIWAIEEDRYDGGTVDPEISPSGDMSMLPHRSPEGLHDGGCKGSV